MPHSVPVVNFYQFACQLALLLDAAFSLAADNIGAFASQFDAAAAFAFFYNQYFLYHNIPDGAAVAAGVCRKFGLYQADIVAEPQGWLFECALAQDAAGFLAGIFQGGGVIACQMFGQPFAASAGKQGMGAVGKVHYGTAFAIGLSVRYNGCDFVSVS